MSAIPRNAANFYRVKRFSALNLKLPVRSVVAFVLTLFAALSFAEDRWVEGEHYQAPNPPVAVGRGDDVIVTEFLVRLRPLLHL